MSTHIPLGTKTLTLTKIDDPAKANVPKNGFAGKEPVRIIDREELNHALLRAIDSGDLEKVKKALEDGADANCRDRKGRTPLMGAAYHNDSGLAEMLLAMHNADVLARDDEGDTALDYLPEEGAEEVRELLQQRLDGILLLAASAGDAAKAELAIDAGADTDVRDKHGKTIFELAKKSPNPNLDQFLLDEDLRINAENGNFNAVARAVGLGADILSTDPDGLSAFRLAEGHPETTAFLLDALNRALFDSIKENDLNKTLKAVTAGADYNAKGEMGVTPLMRASIEGRTEIVILLLGLQDLKVGDIDDNGRNALLYAAVAQNTDIFLILKKHNATIPSSDDFRSVSMVFDTNSDRTEITCLVGREMNEMLIGALQRGDYEIASKLVIGGAELRGPEGRSQLVVLLDTVQGMQTQIFELFSRLDSKQFGKPAQKKDPSSSEPR